MQTLKYEAMLRQERVEPHMAGVCVGGAGLGLNSNSESWLLSPTHPQQFGLTVVGEQDKGEAVLALSYGGGNGLRNFL